MTAEPVTAAPVVVDTPGVYDGMSDVVYHGDPVPGGSISASRAKLLLPPSTPAHFRQEMDHPSDPTPVFDFGHAAHREVLGCGVPIRVIDAPNWMPKWAQAARKEAHAAGEAPVLTHERATITAMADALRQHPTAGPFLQSDGVVAERSMFWVDGQWGVWRRARADAMRRGRSGRIAVGDYKTCASASPDALSKAIDNYCYHMQGAWYTDAVRALGLCDDPLFLIIAQEKTPPYLVHVARLDMFAMRVGRELAQRALATYRECLNANRWPGYNDQISTIELPKWAKTADTEGDW